MKEIELKYFRQEDVQKADSLADDSKENKVAFKEELKKFYLAEDARLKESQKANLQNFKDAYLQEVAEIEKTHQQSLADAKAEHDRNLPSDPSKVKEFEKNYSDVIKGIDTVSKRAKIKALNTYDENTKNEKLKRYDLQNEYVTIYKRMGLSSVGKDNLMLKVLENKANINIRRTLTSKKTYINLVPLFMLVLIIVAYYIGKACTGYQGNLGDVINNGIFVAVVATGAVYIYSQGGFDMSLGSSALTCAIVAALTWNATKNIFLSVLLAVLLGCGLGIVNAIFATMLNLPVMVMTLTMMNILAAVNEAVLGCRRRSYHRHWRTSERCLGLCHLPCSLLRHLLDSVQLFQTRKKKQVHRFQQESSQVQWYRLDESRYDFFRYLGYRSWYLRIPLRRFQLSSFQLR